MSEPTYYTVQDFAARVGASVSTVRRAIFEGRLTVDRVPVSASGHAFRVLIPAGELARYRFRLPARERMRQARVLADSEKG